MILTVILLRGLSLKVKVVRLVDLFIFKKGKRNTALCGSVSPQFALSSNTLCPGSITPLIKLPAPPREQLQSDIRAGAVWLRGREQTLTHQRAEGHHGEEPLQENPEGVHEGAVLAAPGVGALRRAGGHRRVVAAGGAAGTQSRSTCTGQHRVLQLQQHVATADSIHETGEEEEEEERRGKGGGRERRGGGRERRGRGRERRGSGAEEAGRAPLLESWTDSLPVALRSPAADASQLIAPAGRRAHWRVEASYNVQAQPVSFRSPGTQSRMLQRKRKVTQKDRRVMFLRTSGRRAAV